jgi:hypothetical protein
VKPDDIPNPRNPGCSWPGCGVQDCATFDGINGRRCTTHAPVFDPAKAVELMVNGLPGAAIAYIRGGL